MPIVVDFASGQNRRLANDTGKDAASVHKILHTLRVFSLDIRSTRSRVALSGPVSQLWLLKSGWRLVLGWILGSYVGAFLFSLMAAASKSLLASRGDR